MNLKEITKKLVETRKKIASIDEGYERRVTPLKLRRDELQAEILKELSKSEQFSARFDFATVTRAVRKSLQITDETALVTYLKKEGLSDYIKETVNELFEGTKKEAIKQGIALPGTQIRELEYISISNTDTEKDKRKITTN